MNQKTVGLTLRALIIALALILAASPGLPLLDGVAYAQSAAPANFVGNVPPGTTTVTLSWDAVTGATGYQVVKQDRAVGTWSAPIDVSGTSYTDPDSVAGGTYGYYVRAVEGTTEGAWSTYVEVPVPGGTAPTPPTTVLTLTPTASGLTTINLSWTADPLADHYDLRYWTGTEWERIGGDIQTNSYTHEDLTSGSRYFYIVRAVNDDGNGPWQSQPYPSAQLAATTTVPQLMLEHLSRERVKLTWTQVGEGAQYDLQRMTDVAATGGTDVAWARLPDGLLTGDEYIDEAAVYVEGSEGTTYRYRVFAVVDGDQGDFSNVMSVAIPSSGVLPPVPGNLAASATNSTTVVVTWGDVPVAASYMLSFKTDDGDWGNAFTASSPYTHSGRSPGTTYTYRVKSKNVNGESGWSAEAEAETPAATTGSGLPTPRNLRAVDATDADGSKVTVTWSGVSGANSYELRIWDGDSWEPVPLGTDADAIAKTVMDRSLTLMGDGVVTGVNIDPDMTFYFVIRATKVADGDDANDTIHDVGNDVEVETSDWSAPVSVMTKALDPAAPTDLDVIPQGESSVWLSWTQPAAVEDASGTATSYTIEWRQGTSGSKRSMTVQGRTNYLHTNLSPNTEYHYRVRANNNSGTSMSGWWPDAVLGTAPAGTDCPNSDGTLSAALQAQCATTEISGKTAARQLMPPSNIMAEAMSTTEIKLTWDAVPGATGYEIQRWDTTATPPAWVTLDANGADDGNITTATTFTHTGLAAVIGGVTEYYIIRTLSGGGVMSQWSGAVTGMTKSDAITAPTLDVLPTGQTTVRLAWSDAATTVGATGYEIQYAEGVWTAAQFDNAALASLFNTISRGASPMYYVHTGLNTATRYTYRMRTTLANDVNSPWTAPAQVVTRPAKPELTATATVSNSVTLTWDAVTFVTDPASPTADKLDVLADYEIQRRASADDAATADVDESAWAPVTTAFTDGSCATKCTLVDTGVVGPPRTGVKPGVMYYYRIRVNLDGTEVTGAPGVTSYWDQEKVRTPSN